MDIEEQIKQFLDEIYNKYNNLTDEDDELKRTMKNEIYNFLYDNRTEIDNSPDVNFRSIEKYAVMLSDRFNDRWVGFTFLHSVILAL